MGKKLLCALILSLILFNSCKKKDNSTPAATTTNTNTNTNTSNNPGPTVTSPCTPAQNSVTFAANAFPTMTFYGVTSIFWGVMPLSKEFSESKEEEFNISHSS